MPKMSFTGFVCALLLAGCGGGSSDDLNIVSSNEPTLVSTTPASGAAGDVIQIFGSGFSVAAPENVVLLGGSSAFASSYALNPDPTGDDVEIITFTVPAGATLGEGPLVVTVNGQISNANINFTVTP